VKRASCSSTDHGGGTVAPSPTAIPQEKALNSLDTPQVQSRWAGREPPENLLKGDRNANEEI